MQAILITAYKNIGHLNKLVDFFDGDFSIYIHIDKKSAISRDDINLLKNKKNVRLISQKYKINWGGINHLKAILLLAEEALKNKENTLFHLVTGHDYSIKPLSEFEKFAEGNSGKDFMEYHELPYSAWPEGGMDRLSRYNLYDLVDGRKGFGKRFIEGFSKLQKIIGFKRKFYPGFPKQFGGSTYWTLRRESLEYVFKYMDENPKFLPRFKYSFCAEEIFFQTILLNSPLKENIIQGNKRFIVWEVRNGNFPANLDETDYNNITKSEALFARKFEYPVSVGLLNKIEENLTKRD